jgi:hypothetical protein
MAGAHPDKPTTPMARMVMNRIVFPSIVRASLH